MAFVAGALDAATPMRWRKLDALGAGTALFEQGRAELREVLQQLQALGVPESHYALNLSIARGLDYYTGIVYETTLDEHPQIGSICSGGRYDNLASHYTKSKLPGVGISIGLTRLFCQLREAGLIVDGRAARSTCWSTLMDEAQLPAMRWRCRSELRAAGINTEVAAGSRQARASSCKYADRAGIRFVVIRGEDEIARGVVAVKDLRRGEQFEVAREADARVERLQAASASSRRSIARGQRR